MIQRAVCLCDGKYIGIESIYTVINGKQINIPEKLETLRAKSRNGELFCPCGCGTNLILIAGDRNLRAQHFRLKTGSGRYECTAETEGIISIYSRIVLKCWLDEKLASGDVETRVPICQLGDSKRRYEFSFLSRTRKIAVSYTANRANLSDEKFDILRTNSSGIQLLYFTDAANTGTHGQYPEYLQKIQKRKGYCLLLDVNSPSYEQARLYAVFYAQDCDGLWQEIRFAAGLLADFGITEGGQLLYKNVPLPVLLSEKKDAFSEQLKREQARREAARRQYEEQLKQLEHERRTRQALQKKLAMEKLVREKEAAALRARQKRQDELSAKDLSALLDRSQTEVIDSNGVQWLKCHYCEAVGNANTFFSRGHGAFINHGICRDCWGRGHKYIR